MQEPHGARFVRGQHERGPRPQIVFIHKPASQSSTAGCGEGGHAGPLRRHPEQVAHDRRAEHKVDDCRDHHGRGAAGQSGNRNPARAGQRVGSDDQHVQRHLNPETARGGDGAGEHAGYAVNGRGENQHEEDPVVNGVLMAIDEGEQAHAHEMRDRESGKPQAGAGGEQFEEQRTEFGQPRGGVEPGKAGDGAVAQGVGDEDHGHRGVGHRGIDAERTLPQTGVNKIARHIEIQGGQGGGDAEREGGAHQLPLAERAAGALRHLVHAGHEAGGRAACRRRGGRRARRARGRCSPTGRFG